MADTPIQAVKAVCKEYPWQAAGIAYVMGRTLWTFCYACVMFGIVHVVERVLGRRICP